MTMGEILKTISLLVNESIEWVKLFNSIDNPLLTIMGLFVFAVVTVKIVIKLTK